METERLNWQETDGSGLGNYGKQLSEIQIECYLRNVEPKNLVAPLREVQAVLKEVQPARESAETQRWAALALQEQWNAWLDQRDQLRTGIKRGKEYLDQVQKELAGMRARLEDWAVYERTCGKNPLPSYIEAITANERIEQFLPGWLERRKEQLGALNRQLETCARENGLEHLL
jgi:chromosome segregation ATPase